MAQQGGLAPGTVIRFSVRAAIPSYLPTAIFRERFLRQLSMFPLTVKALAIEAGFGVTSRDYTADVTVTNLAFVAAASSLVGDVRSAAEAAGSYTPTISVPSIGEPAQAAIERSTVEGAVDRILGAVGTAAEGIAQVPKGVTDLPGQAQTAIIVVVVGIVALVGFIALSPTGPALAGRVTRL